MCGRREVHVDFSGWHNRIIQLGTFRYTIESIVLLYLGYYLLVGFRSINSTDVPTEDSNSQFAGCYLLLVDYNYNIQLE